MVWNGMIRFSYKELFVIFSVYLADVVLDVQVLSSLALSVVSASVQNFRNANSERKNE
jgi:hypothetical protein